MPARKPKQPKPVYNCKKCKDLGKVTVWEQPLPFNPGSPTQKKALIKHFGLKMPVLRGSDSETTSAKYLKRFGRKHPVFNTVIDVQQRDKLISTYLWKGLPVDGHPGLRRIGTQYGFNPSTWRKSSRQVNLQNIPKRSDLAQLFRRMLVAAPGHVLIEADSSAIEAVLVGFCAGDRDYIRFAQLGIHDMVAAKWLGIPLDLGADDATLRATFKLIKRDHKNHREAAKRGVHGSNYLLSPHGLNDEYPEYFPNQRAAKEFQEFYYGLFPKLTQWQRSTCERAGKETYLDNHFGYRHYFYSVFQWDRNKGAYVLGDDAKRAVAFVPQSDASALQTEYLLKLEEDPQIAEALRLIIHDSFVLEAKEQEAEEIAKKVYRTMTMPIPELDGLSIGAEVMIGQNLADMKVIEVN